MLRSFFAYNHDRGHDAGHKAPYARCHGTYDGDADLSTPCDECPAGTYSDVALWIAVSAITLDSTSVIALAQATERNPPPVILDKRSAEPHSGRIERLAARGGGRGGGAGAPEARKRRLDGREADRPWGAEKHRLAPPRTSISIAGSRCVSPGRQPPAAAISCP